MRPMGSQASLIDPAGILVADTSTIINVNATGCGQEIIRALPNKLVIVDVVRGELDEGRRLGRRDAEQLDELVGIGLVDIVKLDDAALMHFEKLVIGPAVATLDDGEAATIAYAFRQGAVAVLDERKATRICAELFPSLQTNCSVDILAHPDVERCLGKKGLAQAVFNALYQGRMRVFGQHVEWVVGLIGKDQAAVCSSLPNSVRRPQKIGRRIGPLGESTRDRADGSRTGK